MKKFSAIVVALSFMTALAFPAWASDGQGCEGPNCGFVNLSIEANQNLNGGQFVIPPFGVTDISGSQEANLKGFAFGDGVNGIGNVAQEQIKITDKTASSPFASTSHSTLLDQSVQLNGAVNSPFAIVDISGSNIANNEMFTMNTPHGAFADVSNLSASRLGGSAFGNGGTGGLVESLVVNEFISVANNPFGYNAVNGTEFVNTRVEGGAAFFGGFNGEAFGKNEATIATYSNVRPGQMDMAAKMDGSTIGCVKTGEIGIAGVTATVNAGQQIGYQQASQVFTPTTYTYQGSAGSIITNVNIGNVTAP